MDSRQARLAPPDFAQAAQALREARLRPEARIEEVPAPQRIAPYTLAFGVEIVLTGSEEPLATGRFVVLHDPEEPEAWESAWRVVTFASAELEADLGGDPLLGEVGWSWLTDALEGRLVPHHALGGTVTRVHSDSFGSLGDRPSSVEMELRASWSPVDADLVAHLDAWIDALCTIGGAPPVPAGVTALPARRR